MRVYCVFLIKKGTWELSGIFFTEDRATKYAQEIEGDFGIEYRVESWKVK